MTRVDRTYLRSLEDGLAPYAARSFQTRGRKHPEEQHPYRTEFQRDRERIIHSRAFRRLEYKTQVFINHEGDHYRTRLTHSIEVAQIARSIARALRLNEDLAEGIALAHDLGHTPFGHAGERELNMLLNEHGGFEHNRQSLRVVDELEQRYMNFDGLNLTWETREGIIKHSSHYDHPEASDFSPSEQPSLEAQIIDLADEIAYNNHDLDDGISSGLISIDDVDSLEVWRLAAQGLPYTKSSQKLFAREVIRRIINMFVTDLIETSYAAIKNKSIASYQDVKKSGQKLINFSEGIQAINIELKKFLKVRLYQHYRVARMSMKAQNVVRELFFVYTEYPSTLSESYQRLIEKNGLTRTVTDYIAGMTDRYALEEHKKLTDPMEKA